MNRRIYLASSWRNADQPQLVDVLRDAGHLVYDFREPGPGLSGFRWSDIDPHWQAWWPNQAREALQHPIAREGFANDFDAMHWADTCVLLLPCGRSAHLEAGWMAGAGKDLVIYQPQRQEPELMYGIAPRLCDTPRELLAVLARPLPARRAGWWRCPPDGDPTGAVGDEVPAHA